MQLACPGSGPHQGHHSYCHLVPELCLPVPLVGREEANMHLCVLFYNRLGSRSYLQITVV